MESRLYLHGRHWSWSPALQDYVLSNCPYCGLYKNPDKLSEFETKCETCEVKNDAMVKSDVMVTARTQLGVKDEGRLA